MDSNTLGTITGWCDGYDRGHIRGWAWYPRQPHQTVVVEVVVNGQVVAEAAACIMRPDLKTAGIGQGRHAFAIPFTRPLDAPETLQVTVRAKEDGTILNAGVFTIVTTPEALAADQHRASLSHLAATFGLWDEPTPPQANTAHPPRTTLNFILYAAAASSSADIATKLGADDYSYLFVMKFFREVLRALGTVHMVTDPSRDVDTIYRACMARGEECVFFSFAPPHATTLGLACPTIPVIAWEFGTIPDTAWDDEPRNDWRYVLRQTGRAITISRFAANVIREAMGPMFPVASIPTPVWNRMAGLSTEAPRSTTIKPICLDGFIWDSRVAKLALEMTLPPLPATRPRKPPVQLPLRGYLLTLAEPNAAAAQPHISPGRISRIIARLAKRIQFLSRHPQTASGAVPTTSVFPPPWQPETDLPPIDEPALAVFDPDPYPAQRAQPPADAPALHLDGIVFTAVLSPKDGRKNWQDILSAFVFAFKTTPDATLVFKMIGTDPGYWWWEFHDAASRLPAFTCRVVVLHGYLDDENYGKLITATHFVTNASLAEGQCLPLVEFMSASRPAIAPDHTAMSDYITPQNALVVESDIEYCAWPHDPRNLLRTTRYRIHWPSLHDAFTQAYEVAKTDPDAYAAMGNAAAATMQTYCGDKSTIASLQQILCLQPAVTAMLEAAVP